MGGYVGRTRGDKGVFVEEHLPLTVVVTLVLISDMSNDGTPNEVMNALDVGMVEVVTVIVVEQEAITLVA
jgi:hypothetical protein